MLFQIFISPPRAGFFSPGGNMEITEQQLLYIMPNARQSAGVFVPAINAAAKRWQFDRPKRMAAFLAQIGHESGHLSYLRELGGHAYLDKYDTGPLAERLGNTPEDDDDGQLYRGRGLVQGKIGRAA